MSDPTDDTPTAALLDGRYHLIETVGAGAAAHVYRAEDVVLGRTVAIKAMRHDADVLASPERVRNEVSVLASLRHPALVTLLDASIAPEGTDYLVMEFVDGATLAQRLQDGPLSRQEVAHLASELAAGLHCIHAAGFVHRDVKPANVLLSPATVPGVPFHTTLADFGLAQVAGSTGSSTTPGVVVGTAAYLAPERVRGEAATPAADIYALGLVLLEALTARRAFGDAAWVGELIARLKESPTVPDDLGPGWCELLRRMTDSVPEERPCAIDVVRAVAELDTTPEPRAAPAEAHSPGSTTTPPTAPLSAALDGGRRAARPGRSGRDAGRRRPARVPTFALAVAFALLAATAGVGVAQQAMPEAGSPPAVRPLPDRIEQPTLVPEPADVTGLHNTGGAPDDATQPSSFTAQDDMAQNAAREAEKAAQEAERRRDRAERDAERTERENAGSPGHGAGGSSSGHK